MKKFFTLVLSLVAAFGVANADCYLLGEVEGSSWTPTEGLALTETSSGVFEGTTTFNGYFAVVTKLGTWDDVNSNRFYPTNASGAVNLNEVTPMSNTRVGAESFNLGVKGTKATIVVDTNNLTMILKSDEVVEKVITYDVWGNLDGGNDWGSTALTENNGNWEGQVEVLADAQFGIRVLTNGDQTGWVSSADAATISEAGTYACSLSGSNFNITAGTYSFSYNPDAMTLTVTVGSGILDVEADVNAPAVFYNLQGQAVDASAKGVVIKVQGGKASKVIL